GDLGAFEHDAVTGGREPLDVDVGEIEVGGGRAPSDPLVLTDDDPEEPSEALPGRVDASLAVGLRVEVRHVPDGRLGDPEVRFVREEGGPDGGRVRREDPVVRTDGVGATGRAPEEVVP